MIATTSYLGGVDVDDLEWEDIDTFVPNMNDTPSVNIDPSHEGGEYSHFLNVIQEPYTWSVLA